MERIEARSTSLSAPHALVGRPGERRRGSSEEGPGFEDELRRHSDGEASATPSGPRPATSPAERPVLPPAERELGARIDLVA